MGLPFTDETATAGLLTPLPLRQPPADGGQDDTAFVLEMARLLSRPGMWPHLSAHLGDPDYEFAIMLYCRLMRGLSRAEMVRCIRGGALPRRVTTGGYVRLLEPS